MSTKTISLSLDSQTILYSAQATASNLSLPAVDSECLLVSLCSFPGNCQTVISSNINIKDLVQRLTESLQRQSRTKTHQSGPLPIASGVKTIMQSAEGEAQADGANEITPEHILLGVLRNPHFAAGIYLTFFGINYQIVKDAFAALPKAKSSPKISPKVNATSKAKVDTASQPKADAASCGTGCGCSTTKTASPLSDKMKKVINIVNGGADLAIAVVQQAADKVKYRADWIAVLDEAISLSEKSGISVPAAFTQLSFSNTNAAKSVARQQVRREAIEDAIETLLKTH